MATVVWRIVVISGSSTHRGTTRWTRVSFRTRTRSGSRMIVRRITLSRRRRARRGTHAYKYRDQYNVKTAWKTIHTTSYVMALVNESW